MTTYLIKLESVKFDDQHGLGNNIECPTIISTGNGGLNVINAGGIPTNFSNISLINGNTIRPIQYTLANNQYIEETNGHQVFRTTNASNLQFLNAGSNVYNIVNLDQLQGLQLANPMSIQTPIEINGEHFLQQPHEHGQQIIIQAEPQSYTTKMEPQQQPIIHLTPISATQGGGSIQTIVPQILQLQPTQTLKQAATQGGNNHVKHHLQNGHHHNHHHSHHSSSSSTTSSSSHSSSQSSGTQPNPAVVAKLISQTPEIESAVNICQKIKIDQRKLNKYVRIRFREMYGPKYLMDHDLQDCDKAKLEQLREESLSLFKPANASERSAWARAKQSLRLMRNAMLKNAGSQNGHLVDDDLDDDDAAEKAVNTP